jgi:hypothetical protein
MELLLVQRTMNAWKKYTSKSVREGRISAIIYFEHSSRIKKAHFDGTRAIWYFFKKCLGWRKLTNIGKGVQLIKQQRILKSIGTIFQSWRSWSHVQTKYRDIYHKLHDRSKILLLENAFGIWIEAFAEEIYFRDILFKHTKKLQLKKLLRHWQAWFILHKQKMGQREKFLRLEWRKNKFLLRKCINAWSSFLEKQKSAQYLAQITIFNFDKLKVVGAFRRWSDWVLRRVRIRTTISQKLFYKRQQIIAEFLFVWRKYTFKKKQRKNKYEQILQRTIDTLLCNFYDTWRQAFHDRRIEISFTQKQQKYLQLAKLR